MGKPSSSRKPQPKRPISSCNLQGTFDPSFYTDQFEKFRISVEFLPLYKLHECMTRTVTNMPLRIIHHAYNTAGYWTDSDSGEIDKSRLSFEIIDEGIFSISKPQFLLAIGYTHSASEFISPTNDQLRNFLTEIRYNGEETQSLSQVRKKQFPGVWEIIGTYVLRCLSGRSGGQDSFNRHILHILFGIFYGVEIDIGEIIWDDFVSYAIKDSKPDIKFARFWSLVIDSLFPAAKKPYKLLPDDVLFVSPILSKVTPGDQTSHSNVVIRLPDAMLNYFDAKAPAKIHHEAMSILPANAPPIIPFVKPSKTSKKRKVTFKT